jgi:hypothetical protein
MPKFALFDIESRIDWALIERAEGISAERYLEELREKNPREPNPFIPHIFHLPIAIAVGFPTPDGRLEKVGSLSVEKGQPREETLARKFWAWLEKFQGETRAERGVLVSFNARGYDLPVLELCALRYGIQIPRHLGEKYGNRYRYQTDYHLDVLDFLTGYGASPRPAGGLSTLSAMCGLPAKDTDGSEVQSLYDRGELAKIERYNRNDCRRLHVVFGRLQYMRGMTSVLPELPALEDE